jgi:hypothetical protein
MILTGRNNNIKTVAPFPSILIYHQTRTGSGSLDELICGSCFPLISSFTSLAHYFTISFIGAREMKKLDKDPDVVPFI